jgi:hypothetical protein
MGLPNAEYPLTQMAKQDSDGFMAALAAATVPIGGWTVYGAMRLIGTLVSPTRMFHKLTLRRSAWPHFNLFMTLAIPGCA